MVVGLVENGDHFELINNSEAMLFDGIVRLESYPQLCVARLDGKIHGIAIAVFAYERRIAKQTVSDFQVVMLAIG
jgi:hypothetical protein